MDTGKYNKIASYYDVIDYPFEKLIYKKMREDFISKLRDKSILEIGVGTGKNIPYYHKSNSLTAIDQSLHMLYLAYNRSKGYDIPTRFIHNDKIPDDLKNSTFDTVVATFVLYTTSKRKQLVKDIEKLLRNGGELIIFEYKPSSNRIISHLTSSINPLVKSLFGVDFFNIDTQRLFNSRWKIKCFKQYFTDLIYGISLVYMGNES